MCNYTCSSTTSDQKDEINQIQRRDGGKLSYGEAAESEETGDLVRGREGYSHINTEGLSLSLFNQVIH